MTHQPIPANSFSHTFATAVWLTLLVAGQGCATTMRRPPSAADSTLAVIRLDGIVDDYSRFLQSSRPDVAARASNQMTELPDREAMSLVNLNAAIPINLALAANVLSDGSIAAANAEQTTPIDQSAVPTTPTL